MKTTNFFTELHAVLGGTSASISITPTADRLAVSFIPDHGKGKLIPLNMDGTPGEFDEGFLQGIEDAIATVKRVGLVTNKAEFEAAAEQDEKDENDTPSQRAKGPAPKKGSPAAKKPAVKKEAPAMKEAPKKRGRKTDAERKAAAGVQDEEVIPVAENQLSLIEEEIQIEMVAPTPPPQHTDENLLEFGASLEKKLGSAEEELLFIERLIVRGSDRFTKEQLEEMKLEEEAKRDTAKGLLEKVHAKTFGIKDGELIPVEELTANPLIG